MKRLCISLAAIAVLVVSVLLGTSSANAATGQVTWVGNGTSVVDGERVLNTVQCDDPNDTNGSLLWIMTANNAVSPVTITGPWGTVPMTQQGQGGGSFRYTSDFYDLDALFSPAGQVFATYTIGGQIRNANLVISHGCPAQTGAIAIHKTAKHAAAEGGVIDLEGVEFSITGTGVDETVTTDANGKACLDGLAFGDYEVTETVPAGYLGEDPKTVTVDNAATCDADPYAGETVAFDNTPLTDLTVSVDSQVDGGTASTITCTPPGAPDGFAETDEFGDGSLSLTDLEPGTYDCEVVIDP